jgi:RNA ligase (TIGR02306 family)
MSTFAVTAEKLTIHSHPNADALELAQVGLYKAVVGKGQFSTGDFAVYIPEQAVLPDSLIEELGLTGRLAGKQKNRVKAVRLRGELSQGIVCRPASLAGEDLATAAADAVDFADALGITKWAPEVPLSMSGEVQPSPDLMPWVDIENIKRFPNVFTKGEPVVATEKIHGTCCMCTVTKDGDVLVSSKGFGSRHLSLVEAESILYWRAARSHNLPAIGKALIFYLGLTKIGFFGEVYGAGVQDLTYGRTEKTRVPGYAVFDICVEKDGVTRWLDQDELARLVDFGVPSLPLVKRLYEGPFDTNTMLALADGAEQVSGKETHLREGIVIRPAKERFSDVLGGRAILKVVSDDYLTRKGAVTEYE